MELPTDNTVIDSYPTTLKKKKMPSSPNNHTRAAILTKTDNHIELDELEKKNEEKNDMRVYVERRYCTVCNIE